MEIKFDGDYLSKEDGSKDELGFEIELCEDESEDESEIESCVDEDESCGGEIDLCGKIGNKDSKMELLNSLDYEIIPIYNRKKILQVECIVDIFKYESLIAENTFHYKNSGYVMNQKNQNISHLIIGKPKKVWSLTT